MKEEFTYENFIKAIRFNEDCLLTPIIKEIFTVLHGNSENVSDKIDISTIKSKDFDEKLGDALCANDRIVKKIKKLLLKKREVYYGSNDDDVGYGYSIELYLYGRCIKIDTDDIYLRTGIE
jgi:hypothetical protein